MLSIDQCRAVIKTSISDAEIESVRDALYVFAYKLVDDVLSLETDMVCSNYQHDSVAIVPTTRHNDKE